MYSVRSWISIANWHSGVALGDQVGWRVEIANRFFFQLQSI